MNAAQESDILEKDLDVAKQFSELVIKTVGSKTVGRMLANPDIVIPSLRILANSLEATRYPRPEKRYEDGVLVLNGEDIDMTTTDVPLKDRVSLRLEGSWEDIYPGVDLLTTEEAAERLGKAVSTIIEWIKADRVLGLTRSVRGYRIPRQSLTDDHQPIVGMAKFIKEGAGGNHNLAWDILTTTFEDEDDSYTPLQCLKDGRIDDALNAARAYDDIGY